MLIAIDQSITCSGVCFISEDGKFRFSTIPTRSDTPWFPRMNQIVTELDKFIGDSLATYVILEDYAYAGSSKGFVLGELGGIIKYHFFSKGMSVRMICNQHHKMYTAGNARADKKLMVECAKKGYKVDVTNDNAADAISIAHTYRHFLLWDAGTMEATQYQKQIFINMRLKHEYGSVEKARKLERRGTEKGPPKRKRKGESTGLEKPRIGHSATSTCSDPSEIL